MKKIELRKAITYTLHIISSIIFILLVQFLRRTMEWLPIVLMGAGIFAFLGVASFLLVRKIAFPTFFAALSVFAVYYAYMIALGGVMMLSAEILATLLPIALLFAFSLSLSFFFCSVVTMLIARVIAKAKAGKSGAFDGAPNDAVREPLPFSAKLMCIIFIGAIMLICTFVFMYNAKIIFMTDDQGDPYKGTVPPYFIMMYYTYIISLISMAVAFVLKKMFSKTGLAFLLACAFLIPSAQFAVNMMLFSGPLENTLKEGGIFYFVANHDFNFDGYNDEWYRKEHKERTVKSSSSENHVSVVSTARGKGDRLENSYCFLYEDEGVFKFKGGDNATILSLDLDVSFSGEVDLENVEIYRIDRGRNELVKTEMVDNNTLRIVLDENACTAIRNDPLTENERYHEDRFYVEYKIVFPD